MTELNSLQSINLSQFFDSVKFRSGSGSGYHLVIDFCIVMFYMLMILMKFSFVPQTFFRIRFCFRIRIRIMNRIRIAQCNSLEKVILHMLKIFKKFGVAPQSFCEIKILFRIRVRIRIMVLLWISIPDLHFIHRRHPQNFVWIR